jgi:hypothetical protein
MALTELLTAATYRRSIAAQSPSGSGAVQSQRKASASASNVMRSAAALLWQWIRVRFASISLAELLRSITWLPAPSLRLAVARRSSSTN